MGVFEMDAQAGCCLKIELFASFATPRQHTAKAS
jgi:hypothetical protein